MLVICLTDDSKVVTPPSVLSYEMMAIEPGENPSRKLMWKPTAWIIHTMCRSHDDRLPMPV